MLNRYQRILLKRTKIILTIIVCIAGVWLVMFNDGLTYVTDPIKKMGIVVSEHLGFVLKDVYISGQKEVPTNVIIQTLQLKKNKPMFDISLNEAQQNLETIGWIANASVERNLPSTLHVSIQERTPFAIWQHKGKINLVDVEGVIIIEGGAGNYMDLPIVVGEDAHLHAKKLFAFMASEPDILSYVSSIIRVGERRWNVRLNNDIEVKLPEEKPDLAWKILAELHREKKLLDRDIRAVDLRLPDKLFIEPAS